VKNIMGMMQQVKDLQANMEKLQTELAEMEIEGTAAGGLVTVKLNGKGAMRAVRIDPSLFKPEDAEVVEDLILAAHQDAKTRCEQVMQEKMQEVTGGLTIPPGMNLF